MSSKASLLAGRGRYVGDIDIQGQLWAAIVRSDSPSGLITDVDTSEALRLPNVIAAFSGDEIGGEGVIPSRFRSPIDLSAYFQSPIARREVRYVGEPVAVVVAEDPYVAEDARDLVFVDYAATLPDEVEGEIPQFARQWLPREAKYVGCLRAGFGAIASDEADDVITAEFKLNRHTGIPMETRGPRSVSRRSCSGSLS